MRTLIREKQKLNVSKDVINQINRINVTEADCQIEKRNKEAILDGFRFYIRNPEFDENGYPLSKKTFSVDSTQSGSNFADLNISHFMPEFIKNNFSCINDLINLF